jgi:alpha-tubulin suppressor-like RCC1 family protein
VWTWGRGEGGQLGQPLRELKTRQGAESTEYFLGRPVRVEGVRGRRVRKVACGDAHTLVLTEEGEVYVFGFSYQGQLGLGLTGDS